MTDLPDKIDLTYILRINPPSAAASDVARTLNKLIDYLREREHLFTSLQAFAKPVDELVDRRLGPHPDHDPDLK
jgi:hypothetical protein